jgi:hypothetical protein
MSLFDVSARAALSVLVRRLGLIPGVRIGLAVEARVRRGEPFAHLPPAVERRERLSRAQAGPAFVLYRVLRAQRLDEAGARALVAEALSAGAVAYLRHAIGPLRRSELATLGPLERQRWMDARAARFPNAEPHFEALGPDEVRFRIRSCRFVSLARDVGHPDLAPLFCAGDAHFFGTVEPDVMLDRPQTLADGGPECDFRIRFHPVERLVRR